MDGFRLACASPRPVPDLLGRFGRPFATHCGKDHRNPDRLYLLAAGLVQLVEGFWGRGGRDRRLLTLVLGAIAILAGLSVLGHPLLGLRFVTLLFYCLPYR